jgi:hypothetical protein
MHKQNRQTCRLIAILTPLGTRLPVPGNGGGATIQPKPLHTCVLSHTLATFAGHGAQRWNCVEKHRALPICCTLNGVYNDRARNRSSSRNIIFTMVQNWAKPLKLSLCAMPIATRTHKTLCASTVCAYANTICVQKRGNLHSSFPVVKSTSCSSAGMGNDPRGLPPTTSGRLMPCWEIDLT